MKQFQTVNATVTAAVDLTVGLVSNLARTTAREPIVTSVKEATTETRSTAGSAMLVRFGR